MDPFVRLQSLSSRPTPGPVVFTHLGFCSLAEEGTPVPQDWLDQQIDCFTRLRVFRDFHQRRYTTLIPTLNKGKKYKSHKRLKECNSYSIKYLSCLTCSKYMILGVLGKGRLVEGSSTVVSLRPTKRSLPNSFVFEDGPHCYGEHPWWLKISWGVSNRVPRKRRRDLPFYNHP